MSLERKAKGRSQDGNSFESKNAGETRKGFKHHQMQASHLMEQDGVEGWEEEMSHRRADLASAVCKALPVFVLFCFV